MAAKRDTYRYRLKSGNKIVYIGITKDPERRAREHELDERRIKFEVVGPRVTRKSAEDWEKKSLKAYRRNQGKSPKYNKV